MDKRTIGISNANEQLLADLVTEGLFGSEVEAAKFAMAHAIDSGIGRGTSEGAATKWNVGSVDSDGTLKALIEALFPDEGQPYRLVEHLINEGLRLLNRGNGLPPDVAGMLISSEE